jgi:hypothetical protein
MEVKKVLEALIEEDNLDNVSLNENSFIVYFGDILNTETTTGNTYYLLDTYIQIPYTLSTSGCKLHRGIVNEFETGGPSSLYEYSGFVHYSGSNFCWGECNVDKILNAIILEGNFTPESFYSLMLHFDKYLSTSSHDSGGRTTTYKKLDIHEDIETYKFLTNTKIVNDVMFPFEITVVEKIKTSTKVNYDLPYKRVLKEFPEKAFVYKEQTIIPKVVEHYTVAETKINTRKEYIDINNLLLNIEQEHNQILKNEINNKRRITLENLLHQLTNP